MKTENESDLTEPGLVPLIGMSVKKFEAMCERLGLPVQWAEGITLEEKAYIAGLVWLQQPL